MNNAKPAVKPYAIEGWSLCDDLRCINSEQERQQVYVNNHTPGSLLQNYIFSLKYLILWLLHHAAFWSVVLLGSFAQEALILLPS